VIGAGVGGLAAAARLAAAGHTVTVCERAGTVGGKLGLLVRQTAAGVFRFDTGPSLLTMPHVFAELFAATWDPLVSALDLRPAVAPGRSLRGLGTQYLRDPRLRMILDRYATYTGSDPRRAPAALAVIPHVERAYGGWYVTGGLHRLGRALAARAGERGATIRTG